MTLKHKELNKKLFDELVPASGAAGNMAGEIIRACNRLGYRWLNDGDRINVDYGKETCNAAARFLEAYLPEKYHEALIELWSEYLSDELYEKKLFDFCDEMALYVSANLEELKKQPAGDLFDFYRPEDSEYDEEEEEF